MKKKIRIIVLLLGILVIAINVIAYFHAYKFTHFDTSITTKTKKPEKLSISEKITTLLLGISNPKPTNKCTPTQPYETVHLKSNTVIECWDIKNENPKGTVILFHGFSGEKSSLLDKSQIFFNLGYNVFLVDFMGSGGSEGNQTTVGYREAYDVKVCVDYLSKNEDKIILFGTSMGAVAVMKAINDYQLPIHLIVLECPFGTMKETVESRFKQMNIPTFPMAKLLILWGGIQNGFNAFMHNPTEYAKKIDYPTLLLYGEKDTKVSKSEIEQIFSNITAKKELKIYPHAGHNNYLLKHKADWKKDVSQFLLNLE